MADVWGWEENLGGLDGRGEGAREAREGDESLGVARPLLSSLKGEGARSI